MVVALLLFKQINITYKKWYCVFFGFTTYLTLGAFQMSVLGLKDSFHIVEPMIYGTPLTAWVLAPFYFIGYAIIVFTIELVRRKKQKTISKG